MPNPKFFFFFILVHISFLCRGQEVKITPIPYPLDQFLTNIVGMCQDEEGFIWLADNYNGLIKYDGSSKKLYKTDPDNPNSLFSNRLETITAGKGGIIWIGSAQNGLDRFDPSSETFTHYQHDTNVSSTLVDDQISALLEDPAGTLWVGTGKGLDTLNQKTGEFVPIEDNSPSGILLQSANVRVIYEDQTGTIWIGAGNAFGPQNHPSAGLYQFERKSGLITHYRHDPKDPISLIGQNIRAIFEDSQGNFYVGTDGDGLHIMNRERGTFQRMPIDPNNPNALSRPPVNPKARYAVDHITFINEDFQGCIWIGTYAGGINRYNPKSKTMEFFGTRGIGSHHLEKNDFWTMLKTKDGLLWIAGWEPQTENQVLFQVSTLQNHFDHTETGPRVITFAQGSDKGIWIGTTNGLFGKEQDEGTASFFSFVKRTISSKYITDFGFDEKENLWLTTVGGLYFFDRKSMNATFLGPNEKDKESLSSFAAISVLPLKDETVWIGTNIGLDILDIKTGKIKRYKHKPGDLRTLSGNSVSDLFQDSKGNIWVATNKGLDLYMPDSDDFKRVLSSAGASILSIFEDSKQRIWVNSHRSGLFLLNQNTEEFVPFYDASGLITDRMLVKGMVEDESGYLWLNTDIGFIKLEPETRDAVLFGQSWKQTSENNFNSFRTFISNKEEIFTGDASGYFHFFPKELSDQYLAQPTPYFTRFFLSNSELIPGTNKILPLLLQQTKHIKLPYNQNTISIEFGIIDFVTGESEKNILFKLDNHDQDWKNGNELVADYYNLPPGEYVFQVKSANRFGNIGQRSLAITVMPPWFTQWWAWLSYALLLFLMLYWVYGFLLRRKLAQAEVIRLQDLDQVKTRIYTNLTHEFRTPLTVISGIADHILSQPSIENLKDGLPMIKRNSAQLLRLINQMLDLSKLQSGKLSAKMIHDNILGYLKYLTESFHSLADSKDIRLHLLPGFDELYMDFAPEKIQAIFSNLVGNAVKFTPPGGNIYIKMEKITSGEMGDFLEIKVKDTGKGIPSEHLPYIFDRFYQVDDSATRSDEGTGIGLALTKELVQLMSGTIEVSSQIGKGSEFTLRLPIQKEAPKGNAGELEQQSRPNDTGLVKASAFGAEEDYNETLPLALLVEDNEDVLSYLEICLQGKYRIQKARNGLQGIQLAIEMIPDIIVSDVMMPEKDGYEVVERLKKDERTSHIPIILLTAKADLESRLEGLERGADAYLSKPFEKKELEVRLRKLIEVRQKLTARYGTVDPVGTPETPAEIQEDAFLKKLRSLVEANLESEEFGIGELCKELAVSRTQLHRKLKALTNKSTSQVIRAIRMQEAKKLLLNSSLNISEIGYAVGYGNPSHFTQEFTKEFGEAPSFFRKG
ncbi:hybrid sensor histidine kinase/response regulator transcription factor [Cognataquiflexum rubidum]|uniref:hybrid sensor histidine kinase/response regulator transcription factor n=1 Tax=Cognataquiflexum rubidum TaxID=2922273 RepID=UPI001F141150|nr:hybrid sensor histidine kinase/response regulator transcription factor [Cognataquiflexum rubidum]MCH6235743.1 ATP-binding protein [Cognataquiflexum rubidum]